MIDRKYSNSAFVALRFTEKPGVDFCSAWPYRHPDMPSEEGRILVSTAAEIDHAIADQLDDVISRRSGRSASAPFSASTLSDASALSDAFAPFDAKSTVPGRVGLLLSGGMDSGILASYLPGADAYTFRFLGGEYQKEELRRAESFAERNGMTLHYVDIGWEQVREALPAVMRCKGGPVHSIEPQIYLAAQKAKADGVALMIIGDASDYVFGGMDKLLSKDWTYDEFVRRYIYVDPFEVLREPVSMDYVFERYRTAGAGSERSSGTGSENSAGAENAGAADGIDVPEILRTLAAQESYGSYNNAFEAAEMAYFDPYEALKMAEPLDLLRVRSGESKYLIRELFRMRYPDIPVPEKLPMPRPVDSYFAGWGGPKRAEFRDDIDISRYSGNQKWLLWCLEQFLDMADAAEEGAPGEAHGGATTNEMPGVPAAEK